ncbi:glycosyl transferase family 2 [Photobacterium phosphoreum]|uniref:glycosyltransferase family 2 protein n=1 Tax=Photobacterium phosphoreum TaxID=659 RepID=UPI000D16993A|nr:glycosyltransferase [Photobacterium phosphoreum]PSU61973.1 glycosyl transferase family 2 [Photobacterium phosphoreum]PSW09951.1 glycosyl transferase family 2 [Photobacterium phosphoreum]
MRMNDLISVIIPVYNVEKYIDEAIYSIINQNDVKVEVIIVDDCSTDNTYKKVLEISKINPSIYVFKNDKNKKICKTLNEALLHVHGNYIARFDGDDIALPNRLLEQLEYLKKNDLDLVGCQMIAINEDGREISRSKMPVGKKSIENTKTLRSPVAHIWLAKKEVYDRLDGYRDIPYAEDYDFILRAIDQGFKCDNSPLYLMKIRHRNGNTTSVAGLEQRKTHNYVLELHNRRFKKRNDNFSIKELDDKLQSNSLIKRMHSYSNLALNKALIEKNIIKKVSYLFICLLLSIYNFEYLLRRLQFDIKMKFYG